MVDRRRHCAALRYHRRPRGRQTVRHRRDDSVRLGRTRDLGTHGRLRQVPPGPRRAGWPPRIQQSGVLMTNEVFKGSLYIDAAWRDSASGARRDVINPATGRLITTVAEAGPEDVDAAVAAARSENDW